MDDAQKKELQNRVNLYDCTCSLEELERSNFNCVCGKTPEYHKHNYDCCNNCGFDFGEAECYIVDSIEYPLIDSISYAEESESWREHHKCPECKINYHFHDST